MAQAAGADVTGMGYTQLMPISWVDDGNLAFGGGNYADLPQSRPPASVSWTRAPSATCSPWPSSATASKHNGTKGVFIEIANAGSKIPGPYLYGNEDVEWRQYVRTVDQLAELFNSLGR